MLSEYWCENKEELDYILNLIKETVNDYVVYEEDMGGYTIVYNIRKR